jgi:hypothetical protein
MAYEKEDICTWCVSYSSYDVRERGVGGYMHVSSSLTCVREVYV